MEPRLTTRHSDDPVVALTDSAAQSQGLPSFATKSPLSRYHLFVEEYLERRLDAIPDIRRKVRMVENSLGICGATLGFLLSLLQTQVSPVAKVAVWLTYVLLSMLIIYTIRLIPDGDEVFRLKAERLKYQRLAEHLAARAALFQWQDLSVQDDDIAIKHISLQLIDCANLPSETIETIRKIEDTSSSFGSSRETNAAIALAPQIVERCGASLDRIAADIVKILRHVFPSDDLTVKLYARVEIDPKTLTLRTTDKIQALVPVSKAPQGRITRAKSWGAVSTPNGSSWFKARGDPSGVWRCLETGKTHVAKYDPTTDETYYSSALFVCLPGRIGVIAVTSNRSEAFDNVDAETARALAIAADYRLRGVLIRQMTQNSES